MGCCMNNMLLLLLLLVVIVDEGDDLVDDCVEEDADVLEWTRDDTPDEEGDAIEEVVAEQLMGL